MSKTNRERLDEAIARLKAYADELDKRPDLPSADDQAQLLVLMTEVKDTKQALDSSIASRALITDTSTFVSSLADVPDGAIKSLADVAAPLATPGVNARGKLKTLGELFIESVAFEDFGKRYKGIDGLIPSSTKGINSLPFQSGIGAKTLITGLSDVSGGAFVTTDRYPTVTDMIGARELTLVDLVTRSSTQSDTVDYVQITGKTNNAGMVPEAISAATIGDGTGGTVTPVEGGRKPESALAFKVVATTVKTIAHWMPITKRAASDAGQVRTIVDSFLAQGINEKLEDGIASGDGTGENFLGILNTPGVLSVGSAGTDIDAIVDAIRTVRVTGRRRPTALVINPADWYSAGFLTAKDNTGQYLMANPAAGVDQLNTLWGLTVVVSEGVPADTALVGDFRQAVLWEREGITLSMTDSHADFFVRNILAILAEMRAAFGVLDPEAFCKVTAV